MTQLPSPAPWEQQDREPNRAFEHFLYYLYSPRPRKLAVAYRAMNPDAKDASDLWRREAKTWQWDERALAFDVEQISRHGQKAVVNMVHAIELLSERVMESLNTQRGEVWTYEQTITAIRILSDLVPAETVAALRDTARSGDVPSIGAKPVVIGTIVANFAGIAPGSVGHSEPSGEIEGSVQRPALGEDDDGR